MGKNLLARQKETNKAYFDAGVQMGRQQILDMMSLTLNDSEIMGKDTFGKKRLPIVVNGILGKIRRYQPAWERSDEADYFQVKMDKELAKAYGGRLTDGFYNRYVFAPEFNYKTGRWGK